MANTCTMFEACSYRDIPKHTPVVNLSDITHKVYIHLSDSSCSHLKLFQIDSVLPNTGECDILDKVIRECNRPWLCISSNYLDLSEGQHIYKLYLIDIYTHDIYHYYVSFIIQNDDPEKPFIYMNRGTK